MCCLLFVYEETSDQNTYRELGFFVCFLFSLFKVLFVCNLFSTGSCLELRMQPVIWEVTYLKVFDWGLEIKN